MAFSYVAHCILVAIWLGFAIFLLSMPEACRPRLFHSFLQAPAFLSIPCALELAGHQFEKPHVM